MAEKSFSTHVNQIYLPGDSVTLSKTDEISNAKIVLGPGLRKYGKQILVTKPGILRTKSSPQTYWIDCHHRRVQKNKKYQLLPCGLPYFRMSIPFFCFSTFLLEEMMLLVWLPIRLVNPTKSILDQVRKPPFRALHFQVPPKRTSPTFRYPCLIFCKFNFDKLEPCYLDRRSGICQVANSKY